MRTLPFTVEAVLSGACLFLAVVLAQLVFRSDAETHALDTVLAVAVCLAFGFFWTWSRRRRSQLR